MAELVGWMTRLLLVVIACSVMLVGVLVWSVAVSLLLVVAMHFPWAKECVEPWVPLLPRRPLGCHRASSKVSTRRRRRPERKEYRKATLALVTLPLLHCPPRVLVHRVVVPVLLIVIVIVIVMVVLWFVGCCSWMSPCFAVGRTALGSQAAGLASVSVSEVPLLLWNSRRRVVPKLAKHLVVRPRRHQECPEASV